MCNLPGPEGILQSEVALDTGEGSDEFWVQAADQCRNCASYRMSDEMNLLSRQATNVRRDMLRLILEGQVSRVAVLLLSVAA
ncbi:hypothetical protein ADT27_19425 [Xanthomonas oryzae]|nr:hypothetical protein ADT27_19425 [Xanthomonas oryzae]QEO99395.1 hypothetical protein XOCgx_4408 [Xanthomonas oryzae pv. oryzicola]